MESALPVTTTTIALFAVSKSLSRHRFCGSPLTQLLHWPLLTRRLRCSRGLVSSSPRSLHAAAVIPPIRGLPKCFSSSAASFASGGGTGGGFGGGSGGGGGENGSGGGDAKGNLVAGGAEAVTALSPDVIILDVGGMTCGGCAASVKRILENQPQVSSASVNLTTETAVVWPVLEATSSQNWQQHLGEALANHLTNCGFKSNLRDSGRDNFFKVFEKKMEEKRYRLKKSGSELAVSWALCAVCLFGHLSHFLGAKASWIHAFHSTGFHLSLSLFTLLGPGRQLILDGVKSLFKGAPNMNTLVGLGALSSFSVSSLAVLIPKLGWKAFFEEPIMLIAFVLLGRNLEQRAKIKATSDMTGLLRILPSKARLLVNGAKELGPTVEVPCNSLSVGDHVVILPGDRVPADGIVRAGRSTIDESSFTGEPLPVIKLPGSQVAAGSINLNGTITVEVRRPGGETAMGDIVRLVEEAQSREAPVQRLADKVSGHFTYGVMALSAATFMFWSLFGAHVLPAAFNQRNLVSLALQLSCSVLVVACPCALGLATPTAVLVGTSLGATRGMLWRGGNILEKFSMVNTIVFDKTGTLTIGRPVVTKVVTPGDGGSTDSKHGVNENPFQEVEDLKNQSTVYVGVDDTLAGLIYFEDQIREDAGYVVGSLSRLGIDMYMLSGDKRSTAEYVASVIGIPKEKVLSEVKPAEKKRFIGQLQRDQKIVAMVGDGINDAAALASSDIGIAMGGGVGAASEVSSIVLLGNRLSQLLDALELSRLTMKTVKQNLWWAFAYNIVGIPIAAGMLLPVTGTMLTPSIAGALMGLSSIGVMANSLLLRFKFSTKQKQIHGSYENPKIRFDSNPRMDQKEKIEHHYSDARWTEK
ncbi:copper-transporting ATPase PAA1, chloroplastic isoform X2 [Carya illinoinensis]|uniref:copper-transporting ATPase PAA1, chloroplastic isoform X2 n=1 Tax=Carya illinoinensis TaxID=32201 RepID=UPI001C7233B6|nr:copper-transporting ATPase PAA1, chloroplastic isoform X2 [Carya illinoinensis]